MPTSRLDILSRLPRCCFSCGWKSRRPWQLASATLLLGGAMLTKRKGLLFAACVLLAGFAASWTDRRRLWRPLMVAGLAAFALALPWRIWFTVHGLEGDGPEYGYFGALRYLERVWPSFKLAVTTLFDSDLWRVFPVLAAIALVLAVAAGAWRIAVYVGCSGRRRRGRYLGDMV